MKKQNIPGINGYDIPCLSSFTGKEKTIVIISHGFGGSKESAPTFALAESLSRLGIGVCSYDFPAQGDSLADGTLLRINNCINDLKAVKYYIKEQAPGAEVAYFSTSFGAYITLLYLARQQHKEEKVILLSAAINMPDLLFKRTSEKAFDELSTQGYIISNNYPSPMKLSTGLYQDMEANNIYEIYKPGYAKIHMIHGDEDEIVPLEMIKEFAKKFGAELTTIQGANHYFDDPKKLSLVLKIAEEFYSLYK